MPRLAHGKVHTYNYYKCRCNKCTTAARDYQRQRRYSRPDVVLQNRVSAKTRRRELRDYVNSQKNKPCVDCKTEYPPYVMHFDHLGVEPKLFRVSHMPSLEAIKTEIKKCELVCANCHAERTHQRIVRVDNLHDV